MPKIEILVGMIASGKSAYARWRADNGAVVVSHDDLTAMLHATYRYEPPLRGFYRTAEEELVKLAIGEGLDVVVDRTHLTRESRARWIQFAKWPRFARWALPTIVAIEFPAETPEVHARRRFGADNRGRSYEDWLAVARHHDQQRRFEPLELSEGFHQIEGYAHTE